MFGATTFKTFAVANNKMLVIGFPLMEVMLLAFFVDNCFCFTYDGREKVRGKLINLGV